MMNKYIVIFMFLGLLFFCKKELPKNTGAVLPDVIIKTDSLFSQKSYSIKSVPQEYRFEVYLNDLNRGLIRYRYKGATQLKDQLTNLRILLNTIFSDSTIGHSFTTLVWGRLNDHQNKDFTLASRLATAAAFSDKWDPKNGTPLSGHVNSFVVQLFNQASIYPELRKLFSEFGYAVEITSVEKVLISRAVDLEFWPLISEKVNPDFKLPFDCQTWFKLTPIIP